MGPGMSNVFEVGLEALKDATMTALIGINAQWGLGGGRPLAPIVLVQPSAAGTSKRYIGKAPGWRGEVTVRAQAADADAAQALFNTAAAALATTLTDGTYQMRYTAIRPVLGHTGPQVTTRGAVYRVEVMPL